jgi:hypothetical protein
MNAQDDERRVRSDSMPGLRQKSKSLERLRSPCGVQNQQSPHVFWQSLHQERCIPWKKETNFVRGVRRRDFAARHESTQSPRVRNSH